MQLFFNPGTQITFGKINPPDGMFLTHFKKQEVFNSSKSFFFICSIRSLPLRPSCSFRDCRYLDHVYHLDNENENLSGCLEKIAASDKAVLVLFYYLFFVIIFVLCNKEMVKK